jgi:acyl-CoA thioester hydrolase
MAIVTPFRVRYSETDAQKRAHHSHYPVWFEMGRAEYCRGMGFDYRAMEEGGIFLVVAKLECRYTGSLKYDDLAAIETRLVRVGRRILEFSYRVTETASGSVAALGTTILVPVDEVGRVVSLPEEVLRLLSPCEETESILSPSLSEPSLLSGG